MANILPFKGIRFNSEKINDISKVITPPYDIISAEERERYYQLHPNSIIRLILGKDLPEDNQTNNKYTRAGNYFETWRKEAIFIQDPEPAVYVYAQEFTLKGKKYMRKGFISLVKLEEFKTGQIYPHEHTLAKPKEDRLKLMKSCNANFSQVFSFYEDEDKKISEILNRFSEEGLDTCTSPVVDFTDDFGVRNVLWVINDRGVNDELTSLMKNKPLFIADGHHRYETALFYRDLVKDNGQNPEGSKQEDNSPCEYVMMMCVSMDDPGLVILPTHRLVRNVEGFDTEKLKSSLTEFFEVSDMGRDCNIESLTQKLSDGADKHTLAVYIGGEDKRFYILKLKDKAVLENVLKDEYSEWKSIDTGILHGVIFDKMLGIKAESTSKSDNIKYVQDVKEAVEVINEGKFQLGFFLNPTGIGQIRDIAIKRHKMPPKATYFYPKLMTGIVLRHIS